MKRTERIVQLSQSIQESIISPIGTSLKILFLKGVQAASHVRTPNRVTSQTAIEPRKEKLVDFYDVFEQYVEVLCDAARFGESERLSVKYSRLHEKLELTYPEVRKFLVAFLHSTPADAEQCFALKGKHGDAFEALLSPSTLAEFLASDDGFMISRITRTRDSLMLYGDHLRRLVK